MTGTPSRIARAAVVIGGLVVLASVALGGVAVIEHERVRAAWRDEAARVDAREQYDRERSDALYERALELRDDAARAGWLGALGVTALSAGLGAGGRAADGPSAPLRGWAALATDAITMAALLGALARLTDVLGARHGAFASLAALLASALLVGSTWALLARGATLGAWLSGSRIVGTFRAPGLARAAVALALAPLSIVAAPIVLPIAALRRRVPEPPHLRWAGLHARRSASPGVHDPS